MLLYEKNEKKIDIYQLEPNQVALKKYKEKHIIYDDFYKLESTNLSYMQKFRWEDEIEKYKLNNLSIGGIPGDWAEFSKSIRSEQYPFEDKEDVQEKIIARYMNGEFKADFPIKVKDTSSSSYYLITNRLDRPKRIYSNEEKRHFFRMDNLLKLSEKLYTLQLLENGNFSKIIDEDLDYEEQVQLFNVRKLNSSISYDEINKMFLYGLLEKENNDLDKKINTTQKILQKTRRV